MLPEDVQRNIKKIIQLWISPILLLCALVIGEQLNNKPVFIILSTIALIYFAVSFLRASSAIKGFWKFEIYVMAPWVIIFIFVIIFYNIFL